MEIKGRIAEIDALCRDFLLVGTIDDSEDVNAFMSSLTIMVLRLTAQM